jgi:hypothetical protein
MDRETNLTESTGEETRETSRLLSELDLVINQSCVMRDILNRYDRLRTLENMTGPSRATRILRKEIIMMEARLQLERANCVDSDALLAEP